MPRFRCQIDWRRRVIAVSGQDRIVIREAIQYRPYQQSRNGWISGVCTSESKDRLAQFGMLITLSSATGLLREPQQRRRQMLNRQEVPQSVDERRIGVETPISAIGRTE